MQRIKFIVPLLLFSLRSFALDPQPDGVFVRVVDVGAGLCCVVMMPGGHHMIYDAGNYEDKAKTAFSGITNLIPTGTSIDLLVLSHTDSDHVAGVPKICRSYHVQNIVHPGLKRFSTNWLDAQAAIRREVRSDHATEFNLKKKALVPGQKFQFGDAAITLVCGFSQPPADWDIKDDGEKYNAGSIVVRLDFKGRSVLFCGDAVGRHLYAPTNACIDTERFMIDHLQNVPIAADVMVAPHHGADNGSSMDFINAVHPSRVIFSAGHKFEHPRTSTIQRYLACGFTTGQFFRTDRGDHEGGKEWSQSPSGIDPKGDDDVDILITKAGVVTVAYRN